MRYRPDNPKVREFPCDRCGGSGRDPEKHHGNTDCQDCSGKGSIRYIREVRP